MKTQGMAAFSVVVLALSIVCLERGDVLAGMALLGYSMGLAVPALVALFGGGE